MHGSRIAALCVILVLPTGLWAHDRHSERHPSVSCPADVAAAITQACPCNGFATHGQYLRCLTHLASEFQRERCPRDAWREAVRCAAWSTCGKPTAVVCCTSSRRGPRTRLSRDAATCTVAGGTPMGPGSICMTCGAAVTSTTSTTSTTTTTTVVTTTTTTSTSTSTSTTTTLAGGVADGNSVEFSGTSMLSAGFLMGGSVTVPVPSMLTHLCAITKGGGPHMVLALYSDLNGEPHGLVASTLSMSMVLGRMEVPVTPTSLAPGTYWIMGVYDDDAPIGTDSSDPNAPVRGTSDSFGSLPNPFPSTPDFSGLSFNYYLKLQ